MGGEEGPHVYLFSEQHRALLKRVGDEHQVQSVAPQLGKPLDVPILVVHDIAALEGVMRVEVQDNIVMAVDLGQSGNWTLLNPAFGEVEKGAHD